MNRIHTPTIYQAAETLTIASIDYILIKYEYKDNRDNQYKRDWI